MKKKTEFPKHRLVTRRDFLGQGLGVTGSAILLMPTLQHLLARKAIAASLDCTSLMAGSTRVPFLCFDLAGGCNFAGSNVMVGKQGGQKDYLTSYRALGLPDSMNPRTAMNQISEEFGLAFHADSAFLRGLRSATRPETRACVDGVAFCTASNDDTGNNPFNPMYWIASSGTRGSLAALLGTNNNESGGNSVAPPSSFNPAFRPVAVPGPGAATQLVEASRLVNALSAAGAEKVGRTIANLSGSQLEKFSRADLPTQLKELIRCGYINANEIPKKFTPATVDPRQDPMVLSVFTGLQNDEFEQRVATASKLVLDGVIGAGTVLNGGYDYHNNNRSDGETTDERAGRKVGQALELAMLKNKPLMLFIFTDGSVGTNGVADDSAAGRGKLIWTGDDGEKGTVFCLVIRPGIPRTMKPLVRDGRRQIGWFRESNGNVAVDRSATLISNDVTTTAKAVVANYLALHGEEGKLTQLLGGDPFAGQLDQYLAFTQIK